MIRTLLVVLALAIIVPAQAATPVPSGRWSFIFKDAKGHPERPVRVYTYRPRKCDSTCPILFSLPGEKRNAYDYLGHWELVADRNNFIVIAPEFLQKDWPKAASYELGGVEGEANKERWA